MPMLSYIQMGQSAIAVSDSGSLLFLTFSVYISHNPLSERLKLVSLF